MYSQISPPIPYFMPYKAYDTYLAFRKGGNTMSEKNENVKKMMKPIFVLL